MQKYKMIVTDLDDTLLNSQGKISSITKEKIINAQQKGIKFVLASGRPTFAMLNLAKELELDKFGGYILSFNGSIIIDCKNNNILINESLTKNEIHKLFDFSKKMNSQIITYQDEEIVSEDNSEYIQVEVELTKMPFKQVKSFKETITKDCVKCIILEEPSYLKEVEKTLKEQYGKEFSIAISKPFFLEVTKLGVDKGTSLTKLCKILDISLKDTIVVGDSYNDLPMLKCAGLSVAVSNAKPEILKFVDFITKSNDEDGMAYLIDTFIK